MMMAFDDGKDVMAPRKVSIDEPARRLPVTDDVDVAVVGGGMAGVAAAIAAARNGARVGLLERYNALGGLATLGNVTIWLPLCDGEGRQVIAGLGEELLRLSVAGTRRVHPAARFGRVPECWEPGGDREQRKTQRFRTGFNPSAYLLALETLVVDSGIHVMYDTRFCAVRCDGQRITHLIVENKSGRSAIACRSVVDASGDADVCSAAGEATESLATNVLAGWFYTLTAGELKLHSLSHKYSRRAETTDAQGPFFAGDDAGHVTGHVLATRALIRERMQAWREAHPADDPQVLMVPTIACLRMTRRLDAGFSLAETHDRHTFDDPVGMTGDWRKAGPVFAVPLRCLRAVKTRNLMVAGRCISVDATAWDVMRAIPPCVVTGQAAGTAAALAAARHEGNIHDLAYSALRHRLLEQKVLLDRSYEG